MRKTDCIWTTASDRVEKSRRSFFIRISARRPLVRSCTPRAKDCSMMTAFFAARYVQKLYREWDIHFSLTIPCFPCGHAVLPC